MTGPDMRGKEDGLHYLARKAEPTRKKRRRPKKMQSGGEVNEAPRPLMGMPTGVLSGPAAALPQGGSWPGVPTTQLPYQFGGR